MTPYYADESVTLYHGDALATLQEMDAGSVDCIVTSPPYFGLRDYGVEGQYGLEPSPAEYVETMRAVFAEARRVLADGGTLWLNIGDSYSSNQGAQGKWRVGEYLTSGKGKVAPARNRNGTTGDVAPKNLLGIPWRVAFALQEDGWTLRNAVIWHKTNAMPESVTDRLSSRYEPVFLFSKSRRYQFNLDEIREPYSPDASARRALYGMNMSEKRYAPQDRNDAERQTSMGVGGQTENPLGRNPGDVWSIPSQPFTGAHFACMPLALAERCIQTSKPNGTVLDPFSGSGTTGLAATKLGRRYVGIDLNRDYLDLSLRTRLAQAALIDGEAS